MNAANWITLVRIILIPVFGVLWRFVGWEYALGVFIIAAWTDSLDGMVARKYDMVTTLGKFLDPLADKLLTMTALVLLTTDGIVPAWCTSVIIAREFIVTSLRVVGISEGRVIAASMSGKIKMWVQTVCIAALIVPPIADAVGVWIVALMTAVTVWSGIDYLWKNHDILT